MAVGDAVWCLLWLSRCSRAADTKGNSLDGWCVAGGRAREVIRFCTDKARVRVVDVLSSVLCRVPVKPVRFLCVHTTGVNFSPGSFRKRLRVKIN